MGKNSHKMFMTMCTATTNQNQQKNFSIKQLDYLRLSLEQALQVPYLQTIEVTPEMLEEQRHKIKIAEKSVKRPSWRLYRKWGSIRYDFYKKRFIYHGKPSHGRRGSEEWFKWAVEWAIDNFPDEYEKECLKCLELGLKPYDGLIFRRVHF